MKDNDDKLKARAVKMALRFIPDSLMESAPRHLEEFLNERLKAVSPETGESGAVYMMVSQPGKSMKILLVTLDESSTVRRIVSQTTMAEIFAQIMDGLRKM